MIQQINKTEQVTSFPTTKHSKEGKQKFFRALYVIILLFSMK